MIGKKDLIIAALATFCLTATLFMVLPTRSQYDPWIDMNDDGVIDSTDLGMLGTGWGTFGDPAKEVIIANHTTASAFAAKVIPAGSTDLIQISTNGYKEIDCGFGSYTDDNVTCYIAWTVNTTYAYTWEQFTLPGNAHVFKAYEIHGSNLVIAFYNPAEHTVSLFVEYYMST